MQEQELFNWLKERFIPDLDPTSEFDYKDAYSKANDLYIELKSRNKHYDQLVIEKIKYDKLITLANVRYINWTPAGIYSFNLHQIAKPYWQTIPMRKTTEFENNNIENKLVGLLDISLAKEISTL